MTYSDCFQKICTFNEFFVLVLPAPVKTCLSIFVNCLSRTEFKQLLNGYNILLHFPRKTPAFPG